MKFSIKTKEYEFWGLGESLSDLEENGVNLVWYLMQKEGNKRRETVGKGILKGVGVNCMGVFLQTVWSGQVTGF